MKYHSATSTALCLLASAAFFAAGAVYSHPAQAKESAAVTTKTNASSKESAGKKMEKVILQSVQLITPEKEVEANVDTADFTRLVDKIDTAVEYIMHASPQATTLLVKVECRPDGKTAQIIWKGKPEEKLQTLLSQLQGAVDAIENVKVKSGKVEFAMQFAINA